ncbi:MAG: M42 family metallopeptidase [Chloroflexi bacterium]|nr:M42 family metallopeptidase [Chloroflexota bacterium]
MKELIKKLVETDGPSGYEDRIRELITKECEPYADEIRSDALGNLIVRKGSKKNNGKRVMIAGHMDEIGVIVTKIDEKGFIRFTRIGGVRTLTCIGGRVRFLNGVEGVIYTEDRLAKEFPEFDKLYIDVGVDKIEDCPVKVGDIAVFNRPFTDLGNGRLISKALDDRIACAVMIEALKKIKQTDNELYFVFTVMEEIGLVGAGTSAFGVEPEVALAVDVCGVGDVPGSGPMNVKLGKGPTVKVKDESVIAHPKVVKWMAQTAEENNLPYQLEVMSGGGTDAGAMYKSRTGAPTGCVSIPTRYVHSPSEMVDIHDVENAVKFLVALLTPPVKPG